MKSAEFYRLMGEQIRRLRIAKGETQTALALKLREKPNTVSRWESGVYRPSAHDLVRLAAHFGVTTDVLFGARLRSRRVPQ